MDKGIQLDECSQSEHIQHVDRILCTLEVLLCPLKCIIPVG